MTHASTVDLDATTYKKQYFATIYIAKYYLIYLKVIVCRLTGITDTILLALF